jgi:hypothetical protein
MSISSGSLGAVEVFGFSGLLRKFRFAVLGSGKADTM